jgi:hypothetical protein
MDQLKLALIFLFFPVSLVGQIKQIKKTVPKKEVEHHMYFLASDSLRGRDVGTPGIEIAARYIANQFENYGVGPIDDGYFQEVPLKVTKPLKSGHMTIADTTLNFKESFVALRGGNMNKKAGVVFAAYGMPGDLDSLAIEVTDKYVVTWAGDKGVSSVRDWFSLMRKKSGHLKEKGALGLIEIYNYRSMPWSMLARYMGNTRMELYNEQEEDNLPVYWVNDPDQKLTKKIQAKGLVAEIMLEGAETKIIREKNVVGVIKGKDKKLSEEYIILSAHYDHVGVGDPVKKEGMPADSIFNGARDNALGTSGLLMAAKYFGKNRPKRSVIFLAFTAEEKGLLGSEWYAENPLAPLSKCIFNLNIDAAGYNDTTMVTVFGVEKNTAEGAIQQATEEAGLKMGYDPIPEQRIFRRSDHFNFAKKGIPSVLYSPGVTAFDDEITYYYHQVTDNPETLNYNYVTVYYHAFINTADYLANSDKVAKWNIDEEEFIKAAEELYGKP